MTTLVDAILACESDRFKKHFVEGLSCTGLLVLLVPQAYHRHTTADKAEAVPVLRHSSRVSP